MTQASIGRGRRMSTARCYLDPARVRPNLTIETRRGRESLLFEGSRCVGVRYAVRGQKREARAAREVIVSAGTIASPQLLELSGIGQAERLKALGIPVQHDLPGVGENLRDHWAPRMKWRVGRHGVTFNERARGLRALWQGLLYITARQGFPLPSGVADARLLQDPRGPRQPRRDVHGPALARDAGRQAREGPRFHHDHAADAAGQQGKHPHLGGGREQAARDPVQLPRRADRPRTA